MFLEGKTCPLACFEHRLDTPCVSGAGMPRGADVHGTSIRTRETSTGRSATSRKHLGLSAEYARFIEHISSNLSASSKMSQWLILSSA